MTSRKLTVPKFTLGDRLAKCRQDAGLTQETMAQILGVSHSTVAKWEADRAQPRSMVVVLTMWADICRVPIQWLMFGDPNTRAA